MVQWLRKMQIQGSYRGATLVEALAFIFIFAVVSVTFYETWSIGTRYILLARNRLAAVALVNEKMEIIRNLAFEDIAHTTGSPAGNLLQDEDISRSGKAFHVFTQIVNEDDPYDGTLGGTPNDTNFVDYKNVKITVSWEDGAQSVSLASRFVPAGIEQPTVGLGILVVNVTSDKDGGALISGSTVRVRNGDLGFDETHTTDSFGRLMLIGVPASNKKYEVSVSKSGYETVSTVPPYPTTPYTPLWEHASVISGALNTLDIFQNKLAHFSVHTMDTLGTDVPNMHFHFLGGRAIGTDPADPAVTLYNTDTHDATGTDGEKDYGDVSPGPYAFTLEEEGNFTIVGMNRAPHFSLLPDETATLEVKVSPDTATALVATVQRAGDEAAIAGASVHVTDGAAYNATVTTDASGKVFFPNDATPLVAGVSYTLEVTASGYEDSSRSVTITAGSLKKEIVDLTPSL